MRPSEAQDLGQGSGNKGIIIRKWSLCNWEDKLSKGLPSSCLCFWDCSFWKKPDLKLWGYSNSPKKEPIWRVSKASYQQPEPNCQPYVGSNSSSFSQSFGWLHPLLTSDCNFLKDPEPEMEWIIYVFNEWVTYVSKHHSGQILSNLLF